MTLLFQIFTGLQVTLLAFMLFHDWIPVPPLNDVPALQQNHSFKDRCITTIINTTMVLIPLIIVIIYAEQTMPTGALTTVRLLYSLLTIGTLAAWWIPYLFGSSARHKAGFIEYRSTHHFFTCI